MQKTVTNKTQQFSDKEVEPILMETLKEAHLKEPAFGARFAAQLAKDRVKDFNLLGYEKEARETFTKYFGKMVLEETSKMQAETPLEEKRSLIKNIRALEALVDSDFHSWYAANYNKETGRITLYRYTNHFPGFDRVLEGKEGLTPTGLIWRSEEQLLGELKKIYGEQLYKVYADYLAGKDVSLQVFRLESTSNNYEYNDPSIYWTTSDRAPQYLRNMRYRIKIEVKPNEAFRSGGLDEKGNWAGAFDEFLEWRTFGKMPNEAITEIVDLETGKVVFSRKKAD